jgi:sugar phosphate isomerase/epimerase
MYQSLNRSYKGKFPFRLGTTSFIYADNYIPNVKLLGPWLDEIELLFFESNAIDDFPSREQIKELLRLAEEFQINYNVHMPLDIGPGHPDASIRRRSVQIIERIYDLTLPLSPTTFTVHLPFHGNARSKKDIAGWHERIHLSLEQIIQTGIPAGIVSIETLNYPIHWIEDIIREMHLSVCMDVGHLLVHDFDLSAFYRRYQKEITIIHLHGISGGQDHLALDQLATSDSELIMRVLKQFRGSVSLEVFSFDHLKKSLSHLEKLWEKYYTSENKQQDSSEVRRHEHSDT